MSEKTIFRSCFLPRHGENTTAYWYRDRLVGLALGEAPRDRQEQILMRYCAAESIADCGADRQTEPMQCLWRELTAYYAGECTGFTIPITLYGTPFQKKVWEALRGVEHGSTISYSELATRAGVQGARATGSAVGANPIAIVIPCHRILPKSGKLGNYSTGRGPQTKQSLLALEANSRQRRN